MKNYKLKYIKLRNLLFDFGLIFTIKYLYLRCKKDQIGYISFVSEYLTEFSKEKIDCLNNYTPTESESEDEIPVWVCWWQGYDSMPLLCKLCYIELQSVLPDNFKLNLVTKDNFSEFVRIPQGVLNKVKLGYLTLTQFSDILRQGLIFRNGGVWIDTSVWCTPDFAKYINVKLPFWSINIGKVDDVTNLGQLITKGNWSGFILTGKKDNIISKFVFEEMCHYFEKHDYTIDYFIQNLLIRIAYNNIPQARSIIDNIPISNTHLYDLYKYMDSPMEFGVWKELTSDTAFFKLTQKREYDEFANGKETFYAYLKKGFKD